MLGHSSQWIFAVDRDCAWDWLVGVFLRYTVVYHGLTSHRNLCPKVIVMIVNQPNREPKKWIIYPNATYAVGDNRRGYK